MASSLVQLDLSVRLTTEQRLTSAYSTNVGARPRTRQVTTASSVSWLRLGLKSREIEGL